MTLRHRLYLLIRHHDVELAETFHRRCPMIDTVTDLNLFFHNTLAQLDGETRQARMSLDDTMTPIMWLRTFEIQILPLLRRTRFPSLTCKEVPQHYAFC